MRANKGNKAVGCHCLGCCHCRRQESLFLASTPSPQRFSSVPNRCPRRSEGGPSTVLLTLRREVGFGSYSSRSVVRFGGPASRRSVRSTTAPAAMPARSLPAETVVAGRTGWPILLRAILRACKHYELKDRLRSGYRWIPLRLRPCGRDLPLQGIALLPVDSNAPVGVMLHGLLHPQRPARYDKRYVLMVVGPGVQCITVILAHLLSPRRRSDVVIITISGAEVSSNLQNDAVSAFS